MREKEGVTERAEPKEWGGGVKYKHGRISPHFIS